MRNQRGVRQVADVDGVVAIICRTANGAVVRKVTLSVSVDSASVEWEIRLAQRWLDRFDPVLRLVTANQESLG
jgi:hypothetical protein